MPDDPTTTDPIVDALIRRIELSEGAAAWLCHHVRNAVFPLVVPLETNNMDWYRAELARMRNRLLRLCVAAERLSYAGGRERLQKMLAEEESVPA